MGTPVLQSMAQNNVSQLLGQTGASQSEGQLFWFSSPSCCGEQRSLAATRTSLVCFPLFQQGDEVLGETVGQRHS